MNKISVGVRRILLHHIVFVLIYSLVITPMNFLSDTANMIIGIAGVFFYVVTIYSVGWNFGKLDSRRTADTVHSDTPKYLHGEKLNVRFARMVKASLFATIPALILLGIRMITPHFADEIVVALSNVAYRFWLVPFNMFFQDFEYGITFIYFLPIPFIPIFTSFGYKIGLTRFSMLQKFLPKVLYKNKKKDE